MKEYELNTSENNIVKDLFYEYNLGAKPFLKWVGGKRQLLDAFRNLYPRELKEKKIKNYYEPFVGGGAVFFDIAQNYEIENAFLYDINEELILTYLVIQKDVLKLIDSLQYYDLQYKKLSEAKQKDYYYGIRDCFNQQRFNIDYDNYSENWIPRAAQTIFLNRTCFNGLFRFNSNGDFNSPMGKYANPKIVDEQNLLNVSKLLEIAIIRKADFKEVKQDLNGISSFLYFDPPYKPISKTSNFTSYSKLKFKNVDQLKLSSLFYELNESGYKLMLSNSDPKNTDPTDDSFDKIYQDFNITRVNAKRSINSNPKKRKPIKEIVVTNYET